MGGPFSNLLQIPMYILIEKFKASQHPFCPNNGGCGAKLFLHTRFIPLFQTSIRKIILCNKGVIISPVILSWNHYVLSHYSKDEGNNSIRKVVTESLN